MDTNLVLTVDEAARELKVCAKTIRRNVKAGRLPSLLLGRRVLIPRAALDRILAGELSTNGSEREDAAE